MIKRGVKHGISAFEIRTYSDFCIKNLRKIWIWNKQNWIDNKGIPIKYAKQYSNILRMVDSSNMKVTLHKVKAHIRIEGNWWADEFAKIGCQGKGRDEVLEISKVSMNLAIRLLLVKIDSIVPRSGSRWLRKIKKSLLRILNIAID